MHRIATYLSIALSVLLNFQLSAPVLAIADRNPTTSVDNALLDTARNLTKTGAENLAAGRANLALTNWQQAHKLYTQIKDREGIIGTEINQAQALQSLGFYRQALVLLRSIDTNLQTEPNSPLKVRGLLSLGNTLKSLRVLTVKSNRLDRSLNIGAKETLDRALKMAIELQEFGLAAQINLSLANTLELLGDRQAASQKYREAIVNNRLPLAQTQAKINLYRLEPERYLHLQILKIAAEIERELDLLPIDRSSIYTYINLVKTIQKIQPNYFTDRALLLKVNDLLNTAIARSRIIKDKRSEAQAIGTLGSLYQSIGQDRSAKQLTEKALVIAESLPAPDLAYRLHWQLGRTISKLDPQDSHAIIAYQQAVRHLKTLRNDLSASEADLQFSFRDSVEPVYRELVDLLLKNGDRTIANNLAAARDTIESLQVAELENYLRQGCLDTYTVPLDKIDRSATIVYPIILPDRIATIAAIPGQPLRYYSRSIPKADIENAVKGLRTKLDNYEFYAPQERAFQKQSQQIYDLIIAPLAEDLQQSNTKTLVFVLDGVLRNIPMSMLYDGKKYLVESYNLALAPGLQLVPPQNIDRRQYRALLGGISQSRQGFQSLAGVKQELDFISNLIPSQKLLDAEFSQDRVTTKLGSDSSEIVHLATHGEFSSDPEQTFILTWDDRLNLNSLNRTIQNRNVQANKVIDLLVLSACETASGDNRATLGLAGVAIQARTRSTLASLWKVNDKATQILMADFYRNLVTKKLSKAESLKLAQQSLLRNPQYRSPYYWAAFVLVGNWQ
ncbi:CHAT domain-containing protein [Chamaesiphon sp. VAR_69_metabat_338]|uniref:CHAT domain-containing protein n=1 Tax=Chamaesiphon sp. VAR_69_metabat_338 TaxID=2964704 RepID=UPI00286D9318|nr:CHAT domain-containing protein [Chamaesiphon sp. VAR_69_metabat_338]